MPHEVDHWTKTSLMIMITPIFTISKSQTLPTWESGMSSVKKSLLLQPLIWLVMDRMPMRGFYEELTYFWWIGWASRCSWTGGPWVQLRSFEVTSWLTYTVHRVWQQSIVNGWRERLFRYHTEHVLNGDQVPVESTFVSNKTVERAKTNELVLRRVLQTSKLMSRPKTSW